MDTTEKRWDYKVAVRELKTVDNFGTLLRGKLATVDEQTGQIIGLVGRRFDAIQNKTLFDVMQDVGAQTGLELRKISVCRNKQLTVFRYDFGDKKLAEVKGSTTKDDKVKFGVEVFNSFDGGLPTSGVRAFAERLSCLNGMTLPKNIARFSFRSLGSVSPNTLKDGIERRLTPILNTANVWTSWAGFTPNRIKLGEFVAARVGQKVGQKLLNDYDNGQDHSLWGFYNFLTFYISHEAKCRLEDNRPLKTWELGKVELDLYKADLK